jgi:hypothetical protein
MANEEQLRIIRQGPEVWNEWRKKNPKKEIDFYNTDLSKLDLHGADLREVNLSAAGISESDLHRADLYGANLSGASIIRSNLSEADLRNADLLGTILVESDLHGARLNNARLYKADLNKANLRAADLSECDLTNAILVEANLAGANITDCRIYGASAWGLILNNAIQRNLIITPPNESAITVDDLEVAQFIYILLHNDKIRHVIDTITSKVVLILGRFAPERMAVLDELREELRKRDYLPVLFDFEKPASRDLTETISTLAHMARFVIADITEAKSIPAELERIVPDLPSVPVQPIILDSECEYALFEHVRRYPWVLEPYRYENQEQLLATLQEKVIAPAEAKVEEIRNIGK